MDAPLARFDLPSADATAAVAATLAPRLRAGDTLLLSGPIGAGKSHFARAVIQTRLASAGRSEDVPSPTYTLVQSYDDGTHAIWHADLYRLSDVSEVVELGLTEAFDSAICLVEWAEKLGEVAPAGALRLDFAPTATGTRRLTARGPERWQAILEDALAHA